ncbi:hypothetical protein P3T76_007973 [Phytophthora citrophthora]|uniref:Uncharacterized protein n=1 Tax=Phytophthora citrophthora TaxID=4793 RepID=A0AAD9LM45_9STRA|nr:hypothetical protein P3T76_007973 [Phytophthora citrophthora]
MERELTRQCRRSVRVAEFVPIEATRTIKTGSEAAAVSSCKKPLFAGYVEALYARNAWLAVRVDIWTSSDICFRQVKWAKVYLQENEKEMTIPVGNGGAMAKLQKVEKLDLRMEDRGDIPALTGKELTNVLEDVVKQVINEFQVLQVQVLQAATSPRAKFEYEMLQHHAGLEVLVLSTQNDESFVLFALPLLGGKSHWDPKIPIETDNLDSVFIPDGFHAPNFSISTDEVTIFIGYPLKEEEGGSEGVWPLLVEWPARMLLSSQVTQTPMSSKGQSSVELIASCKKVTTILCHIFLKKTHLTKQLPRCSCNSGGDAEILLVNYAVMLLVRL